jgi:hypothetical protein
MTMIMMNMRKIQAYPSVLPGQGIRHGERHPAKNDIVLRCTVYLFDWRVVTVYIYIA